MDALILSCATGGGHHVAAVAVQEELKRRGHHADLLDPYILAGKQMDQKVGNGYIRCVQREPWLFGMVYRLGDLYRHLPVKSPVYWANRGVALLLREYLEHHSYDIILLTHIFPGEMLTYLKRSGTELPTMIYIATDYTCIPFTEELECDYFVIPSRIQKEEFCAHGIPEQKLLPFGIPVRQSFLKKMSRETAIEQLGLDPEKRYLLIAGGSIGAGNVETAVDVLNPYLSGHRDTVLIVVCGTNRKLYERLERRYRGQRQILLLKKTECMAEYVKACDCYLSKPGGISSTEAAVTGVPLVHLPPIPGCETANQRFFGEYGMSLGVRDLRQELQKTIRRLEERDAAEAMKQAQSAVIDPHAAQKIAAFAERACRKHAGVIPSDPPYAWQSALQDGGCV